MSPREMPPNPTRLSLHRDQLDAREDARHRAAIIVWLAVACAIAIALVAAAILFASH